MVRIALLSRSVAEEDLNGHLGEGAVQTNSMSAKIREYLGQIGKTPQRAIEVVSRILAISRSDLGGEPPLVHLRATIPSTIEIDQSFKSDHDVALADKIHIIHVLF